jgi:hypothetical protein
VHCTRSARRRRGTLAEIYLSMAASVAYFTSTAPAHEGEPFHGLTLTDSVLGVLGTLALVSVLVYVASTASQRSELGIIACSISTTFANKVSVGGPRPSGMPSDRPTQCLG